MGQQYEEMRKAKKRFWRIFAPLLVYLGVRFLSNSIAEGYLCTIHLPELLDLEKMSGMSISQQYSYMMDEMMNGTAAVTLTKILLQNSALISTVVAMLSIPVGAVFMLLDRKKYRSGEMVQIHKEPAWKYPVLLAFGAALCVGLNVILIMCDQVFFGGSTSQGLSATYASPLVLQVIGVGMIVPVSEELFYRGVLYNRYREIGTYGRAAAYSALLFALSHGTILQMVYAMILGFILAYCYEKFGTIIAPVLVHMAVNLTSVAATNLNLFSWLIAKPIRACVAAIVCAFIASSVIVYLQRVEGRTYTAQTNVQS